MTGPGHPGTPSPPGHGSSSPGDTSAHHATHSHLPRIAPRTLVRLLIVLLALLLLIIGVTRAEAGYRDLMGFPELQALLDGDTPTGAGIEVTIVEGAIVDADDNLRYMPNTGHADFNGKTINDATGQSTGTTSHATNVTRNFVGNNTSIAPGITNVQVYEPSDWLQSGFLHFGQNQLPQITASRIANHSYVAQFGDPDAELLRRFDYLVQHDDYIQIAGLPNNTNHGLWRSAYNVISVGLTSGNHTHGTVAFDSTYTAGRVAPTLVAHGENPAGTGTVTSWATPQVAAGVALLLDTAQDASLSNGTITNRTRTIHHAETSEVLRAVLMAGADRHVINPRGASLTDYTVDTTNNLDSRYGAGQMNIYNSYRILAAGEQDAGSSIAARGWDYNPAFGGANNTDTVASYFFTPGSLSEIELAASLVWNLDVNITLGTGGPFASPTYSDTLYNLDLLLYDVTTGVDLLLDSSESNIHNSEHLRFDSLLVGNTYELRVVAQGDPFEWDYGLAWQLIPEPGTGAILLTVTLIALRRSRMPLAA